MEIGTLRGVFCFLIGLLCVAAQPAAAQSVSLSQVPVQRFVDNNGVALVGGQLFIYNAGTTTKATTYTDATGSTPQTNPIILNARGEPQNTSGATVGIWLPNGSYKYVLAPSTDSDPPGSPIWTVDNVSSGGQFVPSNAALKSLAGLTGSTVYRAGFYAPGDGGDAYYTLSATTCSISGGDNGSEVRPSSGSGCFNVTVPAAGLSMAVWGGKGDGVTNDAAADQAAFSWAASVHGTLQVPANWLSYTGSATLSDNGQGIIIEGNNPTDGHTTDTCTSGFTEVASGASANSPSMITLTGPGSKMHRVCLQAGPGAGVAALSGAAVTIGGGHNQQLIDNRILWPFDGIIGDHPTLITNTLIIEKNGIFGIANRAVALGQTLTATGIVGLRFVDNTITCNSSTPAPFGVIMYGVAVDRYSGNDVIGCDVNLAFEPGVVGGNPQFILGFFSDVLGDSAVVNNVLIQPHGGVIEYLKFNRWWSGMNNNQTGAGILIDQASFGGTINSLSFVGGIVHGSLAASALNLFDIEGAVCGLTISDNQIGSDTFGATNDNGILYNDIGCGGGTNVINGNNFYGRKGVLASALTVPSTATSPLTLTGNNLSNATTPIVWQNTSVNYIFIDDANYPAASNAQPITAAASIVVPAYQDVALMEGNTTISNISPWWQIRHIRFRMDGGSTTFATGGGTGGICTALTASSAEIVDGYWNPNLSCWDLK